MIAYLHSVVRWASKNLYNVVVSNGCGECRLIGETAKLKKFTKALQKCFDDPPLFTTYPLPADEDWIHLVHTPTFFGQAPGTFKVGSGHMACFEIMFVLKGNALVVGIPYDKCPGDNISQKRKFLMDAGADQLSTIVEKDGSALLADQTKAIMLPSGWLYVMAFPTDTLGIRWTANADTAGDARVGTMLGHMLDAYSNLRNASTGHQQFADFLATV